MSFFDDSHVTEVGLQGSLGPTVGFGEMVSQSFQQQFRVDSARALDDELRNRWLESLRAAQITDQAASIPDPLGRNPSIDPDDPWAYRAFAQHVSGQPIDAFDPNKPLWGYDPTARIKGMVAANEKIKALNNPNIKSFEQILEEVSQMQQEVEGETASMYERSGSKGFVASLLGAIGGSFTTRDPLNLITAPIGAGRTVATRIASEMGIAAATVGYTELAEVAPARQIAGLPERNPLFNIAAATVGAGVIRGGIEGIGYGLGRLRGEDIDFDLRDSQLAQMFDAVGTPSARAGAKALDDVQFIERNNPYGEGQAAQARFIEELRQVQRVMGGEPMTAVARVLPPLPFDYIKKAADFEIVREQAPLIYAKLEAAQVRVASINQIDKVKELKDLSGKSYSFKGSELPSEGVAPAMLASDGLVYVGERNTFHSDIAEAFKDIGGDPYNPFTIKWEDTGLFVNSEGKLLTRKEAAAWVESNEGKVKGQAMEDGLDAALYSEQIIKSKNILSLSKKRQIVNAEYQAAYREVEAEAVRLREQQARVEAEQQRQAVGIFANATVGRPFNWSALQYDSVQARVDAINAFNDTLDEATVARFMREMVGEGEEAVEREVWRTEGGIDIGLKQPVDPEFRISTDDGDMTIEAAMRDLQDDADLDDAMRTCLL